MIRGKQDVGQLTYFFKTCGLLSPDTTLHCIVTGVVASTSVTLNAAQSTGLRVLKDLMDQKVSEYIFPLLSKARPLAAHLEIEVNRDRASVNPQLLFQCLGVATSTKTDDARQESFAYNICSCTPALFDRKLFQCSGAKSELADAIWRLGDSEHIQKPTVVCPQHKTDDISVVEA